MPRKRKDLITPVVIKNGKEPNTVVLEQVPEIENATKTATKYFVGKDIIDVVDSVDVEASLSNYIKYIINCINGHCVVEHCTSLSDLKSNVRVVEDLVTTAFCAILSYNKQTFSPTLDIQSTDKELPGGEPMIAFLRNDNTIKIILNRSRLLNFVFDEQNLSKFISVHYDETNIDCDRVMYENTNDISGLIEDSINKREFRNMENYIINIFVIADHAAHHYFINKMKNETIFTHTHFHCNIHKYTLHSMMLFKEDNNTKNLFCGIDTAADFGSDNAFNYLSNNTSYLAKSIHTYAKVIYDTSNNMELVRLRKVI
jgi:hypothetical protein